MFCAGICAQWGLLSHPLRTQAKDSCFLTQKAPSTGWKIHISCSKQVSLRLGCHDFLRLQTALTDLWQQTTSGGWGSCHPQPLVGLFLTWIASPIQCSVQIHKQQGWHEWGENCSLGWVVTNIQRAQLFLKLVLPPCNHDMKQQVWGTTET